MDKILWYQSKEIAGKNMILSTDKVSMKLDGTNPEAQVLFNKLYEIQEKSIKIFDRNNLLIKKYENIGYYISSNFIEFDELNRNIAFMFFIESLNGQDVINEMLAYQKIINKNFDKEDIYQISKQFKENISKSRKFPIKVILIILLIIVIVFFFIKLK